MWLKTDAIFFGVFDLEEIKTTCVDAIPRRENCFYRFDEIYSILSFVIFFGMNLNITTDVMQISEPQELLL